jgi:predicted ribosome quality control (RQC) complex YloA/Tae2 family protein
MIRITAETLAAAADEAGVCRGQLVRGVAPVTGGGFLLLLAPDATSQLEHRLLVVTAPQRARLHLVPPRERGARREDPPTATPFIAELARRLPGSRLMDIATEPGERLVRVDLVRDDGTRQRLVAELFGAAPNILLLDAESRIRLAMRQRGAPRSTVAGTPYVAPAAAPRSATPAALPASIPPPPPSEFATRFPISAALDVAFAQADRHAAADDLRAHLAGILRGERRRLERLAQAIASDLLAADSAPAVRRLGDAFAAALHGVRQGQREARFEGLYGEGELRLELDPARAPHLQLADLYKRAEKLERSRSHALERRERVERRLGRVTALEIALAALPEHAMPEEHLVHAVQSLASAGPARQPAQPGKAPKTAAAKDDGVRRFTLPSGRLAMVGSGDAGNDHLTFRLARSHDVWLHVQGFPGAHVVLRVDRGKSAPLEDLLAAAQLALHFSKRRGSPSEVQWTPRKYLRKPRGAPPGRVLVERGRSLRAEPDPALLDRMLATDVD